MQEDKDLQFDAADPVPHELTVEQPQSQLDILKRAMLAQVAPLLDKYQETDERETIEDLARDLDLLGNTPQETSVYQLIDAAQQAEYEAALDEESAAADAELEPATPVDPPDRDKDPET